MGAEEDDVNMIDDDGVDTGGASVDQERRIRREIANSNERRRMQSINAGFQSLRTLLPHHEGEKLSKAAILQQTAEYIYTLEQEKTRLLQQNSQLKRLLALSQQRLEGDETSPQLKKKRIVTATTTETVLEPTRIRSEEDVVLNDQLTDLNLQLLHEQRLRIGLEERLRSMKPQSSSLPTSVVPVVASTVTAVQPQSSTPMVVAATATAASTTTKTILSQFPSEETCRLVVTQQDLRASQPPTAILLSNMAPIKEESAVVRDAVEQLPHLTAPPPPSLPATATLPAAVAAKVLPPAPSLPQHPILTIPSTGTTLEPTLTQELSDSSMAGRSYILTTTSRQNLDTIVEAIRHLEGDHLFSEDQQQQEEVTLHTGEIITTTKIIAPSSSNASGIYIINSKQH